MPLKMQYPVKLHQDTKCPQCNTSINEMGGNIYVCQAGHIIEGILLVTLRPKSPQQPVKVEPGDDEPTEVPKVVKQ